MIKRIDTYLLAQSLPAVLFGVLLYSMLGVISVTIPRLQWIVGAPIGLLMLRRFGDGLAVEVFEELGEAVVARL